MSRSKKGGKAPGYEYWTARPGNHCGGLVGKFTKVTTHRAERRANKKAARELPAD